MGLYFASVVTKHPSPPVWFRPLAILVVGNVLFGSGLFFHAFLYNFYLEALQWPASVMGYAAAALTAGGLASLLPAGWLTDRWGGRGVVIVAAAVTACGLVAGALVERPWAMYVAASLAGAGGGFWRVAVNPLLMRLSTDATRPRVFAWNVGLLILAGGGGVVLAGWLPGVLERTWDLSHLAAVRAALLAGALGTGLSATLFSLLPRLGRAGGPAGPARPGRPTPWVMLGAAVWVALWMVGPALVAPFFNIYFTRTYGLSVGVVGSGFGVAHLLWGAGVLLSGELAARIGVQRALAMTLMAFAPAMWGLSIGGGVLVVGTMYMFQGLVSPIANPLIDQALLARVEPAKQGLISSWRQIAADASAMVGAGLGGELIQAGGFTSLFAASGAIGLLGAVGLLYRLHRSPMAAVLAAE